MRVRDLMSTWEHESHHTQNEEHYQVRLSLRDAARLEALQGLYPGVSLSTLISQLLGAALDEVEKQMPYKQGSRVVSVDELGDPLYEDVGLTPRYLELRQAFMQKRKRA